MIIAGFQGYMAEILGQVSNEEKPWQNFSVEEDEIAIYVYMPVLKENYKALPTCI